MEISDFKYEPKKIETILRIIVCLKTDYKESKELLRIYCDYDLEGGTKLAKTIREIVCWLNSDDCYHKIENRFAEVQEYLDIHSFDMCLYRY